MTGGYSEDDYDGITALKASVAFHRETLAQARREKWNPISIKDYENALRSAEAELEAARRTFREESKLWIPKT